MNDQRQFGGSTDPQDESIKLASWLRQVLKVTAQVRTEGTSLKKETQLELLFDSNYHQHFYRQIPDFVMALLKNETGAVVQYASLLYHLAGCDECHRSYVDLYDAMRAAVQPKGPRPVLGQGTRTLAATPQRMLGHLCETLISQAEALLRQGKKQHINNEAQARSLLQLALGIGARIGQNAIRQRALHDLVRVANLTVEVDSIESGAILHTYASSLASVGGMRVTRKVLRRADVFTRAAEPVIHLQSNSLEGSIIQKDQTLQLHLRDLDEAVRGKYIIISVPLGSLIEPVRWVGGNPRAICSAVPVDATGTLVTPLGQTELNLDHNEERALLETMFLLLEVRTAD